MRKVTLSLVVGGIVATSVFALAASIIVVSDDLGAGDDTVASCDDSVNASYTVAYTGTPAEYRVTEVVVDDIDATNCTGEEISVTLTDSGGAAVGGTDTPVAIVGASTTVPIATQPTAEEVTGIQLVISGDDPTP